MHDIKSSYVNIPNDAAMSHVFHGAMSNANRPTVRRGDFPDSPETRRGNFQDHDVKSKCH